MAAVAQKALRALAWGKPFFRFACRQPIPVGVAAAWGKSFARFACSQPLHAGNCVSALAELPLHRHPPRQPQTYRVHLLWARVRTLSTSPPLRNKRQQQQQQKKKVLSTELQELKQTQQQQQKKQKKKDLSTELQGLKQTQQQLCQQLSDIERAQRREQQLFEQQQQQKRKQMRLWRQQLEGLQSKLLQCQARLEAQAEQKQALERTAAPATSTSKVIATNLPRYELHPGTEVIHVNGSEDSEKRFIKEVRTRKSFLASLDKQKKARIVVAFDCETGAQTLPGGNKCRMLSIAIWSDTDFEKWDRSKTIIFLISLELVKFSATFDAIRWLINPAAKFRSAHHVLVFSGSDSKWIKAANLMGPEERPWQDIQGHIDKHRHYRRSLRSIVSESLKKELSKSRPRAPDWSSPSLTKKQIQYAAHDAHSLLDIFFEKRMYETINDLPTVKEDFFCDCTGT